MEKDNEFFEGAYDFGARINDPRLGRWLAIDPQFRDQVSWSPYKSFYDNPIVYKDPDGEAEYITVIYTDQRTGLSVTHTEKVNAHVIRTDGKIHKISEIGENHYYENNYYDYQVTLNINIDKNGEVLIASSGRYMYENGVKDSDVIWVNGDEAGTAKTDWGSKLDISNLTGNTHCEMCGDNSDVTLNGGIIFSGKNSVKDGINDAMREYISNATEQVDQDLISLVGGAAGNSPRNLYDRGKAIADGIGKLQEVIEGVTELIPSKGKQYPTPSEYVEPKHDGNSGGEYINKDSTLYRRSVYDKNNKHIATDTIDTSKEKMK